MEKDTEAAFHRIIDILEHAGIAYRITGGFAARIYGSVRPLADIDIEVEDINVRRVAALARDYVISGPGRYKDAEWDLELATLQFSGQVIDIAGVSAQIYDRKSKTWVALGGEISSSENHIVFGRSVPVEPLTSLLAYKERLGREVDLRDISELCR